MGKKILAPVSGKAIYCQNSVRFMPGGMELVMECQGCGAGDLNNPDCYRGVIGAIQSRGIPSAIILRSHIERRQNPKSTRIMGRISEIVNLADDLLGQLNADSRRNDKCSGCLGPLISNLKALKSGFLSMKIRKGLDLAGELEHHHFRSGGRCDECSGMTRIQLSSISKMAGSLERDILAGTLNIVEVSR